MIRPSAVVPAADACSAAMRAAASAAYRTFRSPAGKLGDVADTVTTASAMVLAYGRTATFRKLRCTWRTAGITCRSTGSGHGFRLTIQKQEVF